MGKITVKGLRVFAYHGVNVEEKRDGQHSTIDLTAFVDLSAACASDSIDDTVSYAKITKAAIRVMTEQSYDLLEWVAQWAVKQIFQEYPAVVELEALFMKPGAPIQTELEHIAVSIAGKRSDSD